jgi:hypothetical protein
MHTNGQKNALWFNTLYIFLHFSIEERDGIRLPLPETENLIPSVPEDNYMSSLHLEENEN